MLSLADLAVLTLTCNKWETGLKYHSSIFFLWLGPLILWEPSVLSGVNSTACANSAKCDSKFKLGKRTGVCPSAGDTFFKCAKRLTPDKAGICNFLVALAVLRCTQEQSESSFNLFACLPAVTDSKLHRNFFIVVVEQMTQKIVHSKQYYKRSVFSGGPGTCFSKRGSCGRQRCLPAFAMAISFSLQNSFPGTRTQGIWQPG